MRKVAIINEEYCVGCTLCIDKCPFDSIIGSENLIHRVNYNECPGCKLCINVCPTDCISLIEIEKGNEYSKEKIKFNFNRKKARLVNISMNQAKSINNQIENLIASQND
ncbi:MAG: RnfABCDGE type electron transport complex subunit B [Pseudomonadota bacterium]|nr:RnfABCDGE type electron transport complex subunit B [Pseudomonadota bacterium]|tara:strand:+ start:3837 stop:4163 length:327 start_codon:yes stop_codon:yes gene_type:complete